MVEKGVLVLGSALGCFTQCDFLRFLTCHIFHFFWTEISIVPKTILAYNFSDGSAFNKGLIKLRMPKRRVLAR